jgi:quinolinate synthase
MDIINEINQLKAEKDAVILAHNYQVPEIQDIADHCGDSLELARLSRGLECSVLVFCGVLFMGETAKILSPEKTVLMPRIDAGCPLADMITPRQLRDLKAEHPGVPVVCYVNSTAEIKALSDVCCTSGNAVELVRHMSERRIIFVPDKNLGWWVQKNNPDKEIILWDGGCPIHEEYTTQEIGRARILHPAAPVIVHPECPSSVLEAADYVASTAGMLKVVDSSSASEFIVGTEEGMLHRLQCKHPEKKFYPLAASRICPDMKKITLTDVRDSLRDGKCVLELEPVIMDKARKALEAMIAYV